MFLHPGSVLVSCVTEQLSEEWLWLHLWRCIPLVDPCFWRLLKCCGAGHSVRPQSVICPFILLQLDKKTQQYQLSEPKDEYWPQLLAGLIIGLSLIDWKNSHISLITAFLNVNIFQFLSSPVTANWTSLCCGHNKTFEELDLGLWETQINFSSKQATNPLIGEIIDRLIDNKK